MTSAGDVRTERPIGSGTRHLLGAPFGSVTVSLHEFRDSRSALPVEPRRDAALRVHVVDRGTIHFASALIGRPESAEFSLSRRCAVITLDPLQPQLRTVTGSRVLTASVPAAIVQEVPLDPQRLHVVPTSSPLLQPAAAFLRSAAETIVATRFTEYFFERLVQELALGLVVEAAGLRSDANRRNPMVFAMAVIAAQCADPELSAAAVAREVNVSQRHLERLFRIRGTSIAHQIRRARVDMAAALLRDPAQLSLTVDQIAQSVGFSNGSSLARAMASEGRPSPSQMRPSASRALPTSLHPRAIPGSTRLIP